MMNVVKSRRVDLVMNIPRNALLELAGGMSVLNFQNLQKRGQLPFPEGVNDGGGYWHPLGVVLALSEAAFKFTKIDRSALAKLFRSRQQKVISAFQTYQDGDEVVLAIGLRGEEFEMEFGTWDVFAEARETFGTPNGLFLIDVGETFKGLKERYASEGLVV